MTSSRGHRLKVVLDEEERVIIVSELYSMLLNLIKNGVYIDNLCGGRGIYGKCTVRIINGRLSPPTNAERRWIDVLGPDVHQSCQTMVLADGVIELKKKARIPYGKI